MELYTTAQAAKMLGTNPNALRSRQTKGYDAPEPVRPFPRVVRYTRESIEAYAERRGIELREPEDA